MIFHLPKLNCWLGFSSFKILTCTYLDVTDLSSGPHVLISKRLSVTGCSHSVWLISQLNVLCSYKKAWTWCLCLLNGISWQTGKISTKPASQHGCLTDKFFLHLHVACLCSSLSPKEVFVIWTWPTIRIVIRQKEYIGCFRKLAVWRAGSPG